MDNRITEPVALPAKKARKAKKDGAKGKRRKRRGRASWLDRARSGTTAAVLGVGLAMGAAVGALLGRRR